MNNLTVALAALGGVVLAGVVVHGAWQARKADPKRADAPTGHAHGDPRAEPSLDDTVPMDGAAADASASAEPTAHDLKLPRRAPLRIDALIDAIAGMQLDPPVSGDLVLAHLPPSRRAGSKPLLIEGLNADNGEWESPVPGQRYSEFQAGVQLANRTGALNEIEFSEFVHKVQAFADGVGAMPDFPDMLEVVARARELDAFASDCDAQLAVLLRARSAAWSVAYVQQHAGRHGFTPGSVPGRMVLPASEDGAPPVLTLTFDSQAALADDPNISAVRELTLSFDVPQTSAEAQPFQAWQGAAEALAKDLDAALGDDSGRPLSGKDFDDIGSQLGQLYEMLQARDLAAGSAAARRLFS
ncbi:MAG: hypothetical protein RJA98_4147 [Pseudomonadota bacterium]|jgi:hypothetical protein